MALAPQITESDQRVLDDIFDRAVAMIEDGSAVEVDLLPISHAHLRRPAEDLMRIARQLAIGPPRPTPLPAIEGYSVLSEIGRGGMGAVFLARQEELGGRLIALKLLPPQFAASPRSRERFRDEANAIARLNHPNIVSVHEVVHDRNIHAYAMEWVDGASLARVIEHLAQRRQDSSTATACDRDMIETRAILGSPPRSPADPTYPIYIIRLGLAIAGALEAVHQAGMLHRDVKPSNILLRRDGTPLLSDFGLVREADATITQTTGFAGTPLYAPPQQLRGHSESLDARSDIYSLGVTLYHALALRAPYDGSSTTAILRQIESGRAVGLRQIRPKIPRDLETIVAKAMDPDPDQRYQTAAELARDLERLLNLQPIQARRTGAVARSIRMMRWNRSAVAVALPAALLSVLLGMYALVAPGIARAHIASARLGLLAPGQTRPAEFDPAAAESSGGARRLAPGPLARDEYERAIAEYDTAMWWLASSRQRQQVRLERDVVRVALAIAGVEDRSIPGSMTESAPVTARVAHDWIEAGAPRPVSFVEIAGATPLDLRCLGLLAYLCGEVSVCHRALEQSGLDLGVPPDPLVDLALGQVYLVLEQGALAYPRLDRAFQAFPECRWLCVLLADVAVRNGDLTRADRLLTMAEEGKRSGAMHDAGSDDALRRVRADIHRARDRLGELDQTLPSGESNRGRIQAAAARVR